MTLRKRAVDKIKPLSVPVSYRVLDRNKLSDARNIFDNKGVRETRYGLNPFNEVSLGGPILSLSYFKKADGTRYRIAKVGGTLYSYQAVGNPTVLKNGLTETTRHRAVTLNNRHIISIEGDGLYSFDGDIFTPLGQLPPTGITVAVAAGGTLTPDKDYRVGVTFYLS